LILRIGPADPKEAVEDDRRQDAAADAASEPEAVKELLAMVISHIVLESGCRSNRISSRRRFVR
jgi:hypothetical protein